MLTRWTAGLAGACLLICAPVADARSWTVRSGDVSASVRLAGDAVTVSPATAWRSAAAAHPRSARTLTIPVAADGSFTIRVAPR